MRGARWLYTPRGQEIFKEIQAKYANDREFREAADRYCADFERLITRAGRTESGRQQARAYQMSDTGKAYLLLAHAERLEPYWALSSSLRQESRKV